MPTSPSGPIDGAGIYCIKNKNTGALYVGSAVNMRVRFRMHNSLLQRGKHHSIKLQRSWNKHGEDAFSFEVLERLEVVDFLVEREQFYIDKFGAANSGYNICATADSNRGRKLTEEHKKNISLGLIGRIRPPETRAKISAAQKGKTLSEEHANNVRADAKRRKPMTEAHSTALRNGRIAALTGKTLSQEHRDKIRAKATGRKHSPETRAKISAAKQGV